MTRQGPKTLAKVKPQQQNSEGRQIFSRPGSVSTYELKQ